jgi:hypothetical protein
VHVRRDGLETASGALDQRSTGGAGDDRDLMTITAEGSGKPGRRGHVASGAWAEHQDAHPNPRSRTLLAVRAQRNNSAWIRRYDRRVGIIWAVSLVTLVCLLMALVVLDQLGFKVAGRSWLPWRRGERTRAAMETGVDQVTALFYATKHYELEQRKTEFMLREDTEDGVPGRFRLDLDGDVPVFLVNTGRSPDPEPDREA